MDPFLFATGIAIGLSVAAPLGPVNIIVIRTALRRGAGIAILAGLGAVLADGLFAAVAAYGIRSVQHVIASYAVPLSLLGGTLLVIIGVQTARKHVELNEIAAAGAMSRRATLRLAAATFGLTVINPGALFGFLAIFGAMGAVLHLGSAPYRPLIAVAGVAAGGLLWWVFISVVVERLKTRFNPATIDRINRWTGVLIAAFGFALLMDALF